MKSLLGKPRIYNGLQNLLAGRTRRRSLATQYLTLPPEGRVLDIGCGTANLLAQLPDGIDYVGFDASEQYIAFARRRFANRRATFHCERIERTHVGTLGAFDLVVAAGILHHIDDDDAHHLLALARDALADDGALFTVDPCFVEDQGWLARFIVGSDRGEYVRTLEDYVALARAHFSKVMTDHRSDLLRIPYDHNVMICRP